MAVEESREMRESWSRAGRSSSPQRLHIITCPPPFIEESTEPKRMRTSCFSSLEMVSTDGERTLSSGSDTNIPFQALGVAANTERAWRMRSVESSSGVKFSSDEDEEDMIDVVELPVAGDVAATSSSSSSASDVPRLASEGVLIFFVARAVVASSKTSKVAREVLTTTVTKQLTERLRKSQSLSLHLDDYPPHFIQKDPCC